MARVNATAVNDGAESRASRTRRRAPKAAEHEVQAFRLRADHGLTFADIGARLGMSTAGAYQAYRRELVRTRDLVSDDDVRDHVDLQLHRLDQALLVASNIAADPSERSGVRLSADRIMRIEERRGRLLGLDDPCRPKRRSPREERRYAEQQMKALEAFGMEAAIPSPPRAPEHQAARRPLAIAASLSERASCLDRRCLRRSRLDVAAAESERKGRDRGALRDVRRPEVRSESCQRRLAGLQARGEMEHSDET